MAFGVWSDYEILQLIEFAATERIKISREVAIDLLDVAEKASIAIGGHANPEKIITTMKQFDNAHTNGTVNPLECIAITNACAAGSKPVSVGVIPQLKCSHE
jgi:hypothetical protein